MSIRWSRDARDDVDRLADFVAHYDPAQATLIEADLGQAPKSLMKFPRRGPRLDIFDPREIREYRIGSYVLRYELTEVDIVVLRFFHAREDRF